VPPWFWFVCGLEAGFIIAAVLFAIFTITRVDSLPLDWAEIDRTEVSPF
jgi:hypothetical protein